jgi:hypothetical protein
MKLLTWDEQTKRQSILTTNFWNPQYVNRGSNYFREWIITIRIRIGSRLVGHRYFPSGYIEIQIHLSFLGLEEYGLRH